MILTNVVIVLDLNCVVAWFEVVVDSPPKFFEISKASCPHPNNKMLVFRIYPLLSCAIHRTLVLLTSVILPGDVVLLDLYWLVVGTVESVSVIEEAFC